MFGTCGTFRASGTFGTFLDHGNNVRVQHRASQPILVWSWRTKSGQNIRLSQNRQKWCESDPESTLQAEDQYGSLHGLRPQPKPCFVFRIIQNMSVFFFRVEGWGCGAPPNIKKESLTFFVNGPKTHVLGRGLPANSGLGLEDQICSKHQVEPELLKIVRIRSKITEDQYGRMHGLFHPLV